jgi:hypothetical protein
MRAKVGGHESGVGGDGDHGEGGLPQRIADAADVVRQGDAHRDDADREDQDRQVGAHLCELRHQRAAVDGPPVEGEVDRSSDHEHHRDHIDRHRVEEPDRGGPRRKAAGGHGGECMVDGVECVHPSDRVCEAGGEGQGCVDAGDDLRGVNDAGGEPFGADAGSLRIEGVLHPRYRHRGDCDYQHHNSHAPEQLHRAAPEEHGIRLDLRLGKQRGSRGGESAHRLEVGVKRRPERSGGEQRDRSRQSGGDPGERHRREPVGRPDHQPRRCPSAGDGHHRQPEHQRRRARDREGIDRPPIPDQAHTGAEQHSDPACDEGPADDEERQHKRGDEPATWLQRRTATSSIPENVRPGASRSRRDCRPGRQDFVKTRAEAATRPGAGEALARGASP